MKLNSIHLVCHEEWVCKCTRWPQACSIKQAAKTCPEDVTFTSHPVQKSPQTWSSETCAKPNGTTKCQQRFLLLLVKLYYAEQRIISLLVLYHPIISPHPSLKLELL